MSNYLRQATASQARSLGPFLDDTDFKTAETGLTIANTDVKLLANGAASANKNSLGGTHRINGHYGFTFDATDTATVGELEVSIVVAGALPVWKTFVVLEEAVYDALFAASALGYVADQPVNVTKVGGAAQSAGDLYGRIGSAVGSPTQTITDDLRNLWLDTDDIQSRLPAALVGGRMDTSVGAMQANTVTAAAVASDAVVEIQAGLSVLDAAGVRSALGVASANLDSQLAVIGSTTLLLQSMLEVGDGSPTYYRFKAGAVELAPTGGSAPTTAQIADRILGRSLAGGADGGRTVQDALRSLRNKAAISGGTLTVYGEDDATPAWTAAVTTTAGDPISAIDPA